MRLGRLEQSRKIRSGQLKQRLVLYSKTYTEKRNASFSENWTEIDTVWSSIKHETQTEKILGKGINNTIIAIIEIRYRSDINTNCKGTWNSNTYNFTEVINVNNENRKLLITAEVRSHEQS